LEQLFLQGKYHQQFFYDKSEDFPKAHVESYIIFRPSSEYNIFLVLTPIFIIVGFVAGLIALYKIFTLKKKEASVGKESETQLDTKEPGSEKKVKNIKKEEN
jgi:hypothetical protein